MNIELLKEKMNTPEFKKGIEVYFAKVNRQEDRDDVYVGRIRSTIEPMQNPEFLAFVDRICKWETAYEDRYYKRGIQTTSNLFNRLFDAISQKEYSRPCKNEMFLAEKYIYKGLTFKLYIGQGSFIRITMGKRLIFQTR